MHLIEELFSNYGYFVLLIGLFLELIALPIPGEIMMSYCGYLVFKGDLNWFLSIVAASTGVILGITISYFLGLKLGYPFFKKHGKLVHLNPERLDKMSTWFNSFGRHVIFMTYYIPGVRHFSGYLAGITRISFVRFAWNAYLGAILWTTVFITLGKVLGKQWDKFHGYVSEFGMIGGVILLVVAILYYSIRSFKKQIIQEAARGLNFSVNLFHSMGKMKIAVTAIFVVFLGLAASVIGLIRSFFLTEYVKFDEVANYIVSMLYSSEWSGFMRIFAESTSILAITIVSILCLYLILEKGFDRFLEIKFLLLTIAGGEFFSRILQQGFQRMHPIGYSGHELIRSTEYSYPSTEVMMVIIAYGFMTYLAVRHKDNRLIRVLASTCFIVVAVFSGQSILYFGAQYPSDVLAGYVFGGLWLSLNLIMLEIYRFLPRAVTLKNRDPNE